ncbi:hypothetical protein ASPCADRAFT_8948 [Aspergillus carbonarius ITEM 5010]|uniref:Uncharacterized protein n=1 Tax=Aspergillus carbonarius (strain ITEM 5010) TaxID=602072 RepID=A0A1R3RC85_ASPC5|nr:hypothetical protein ASPCADRAFT_8948 [Aspergillus carbonarius ITEM 5010]
MDVKDLCNETKQNTKQIQILQVDVTKTMERLQTFQKEIKSEFANVYDRFTTIDARLDKMSAIIANSTLVYLPQKISPLPVFDNSYNRLPIPECFPSRLAGFVSLKYRKNWSQLQELLTYYKLGAVTIQVIHEQDSVSTDYNPATSQRRYTQEQLQDAIESDPDRAVSILASHLGIDHVILKKRNSSLELEQTVQQLNKRTRSEDSEPKADMKWEPENTRMGKCNEKPETPSKKRRVTKTAHQLPERGISPSSSNTDWDSYHEAQRSVLSWEVDSSKFRRETAHLNLHDTTYDHLMNRDDGFKSNEHTEKEPIPRPLVGSHLKRLPVHAREVNVMLMGEFALIRMVCEQHFTSPCV